METCPECGGDDIEIVDDGEEETVFFTCHDCGEEWEEPL